MVRNHNLRGCIGTTEPIMPINEAVTQLAIAAAVQDHRFPPVTVSELKDIKIEISVLTEPKEISSWHDVRLGIDGVIVRKGYSSGVFLPQVATENNWTREQLLENVCGKAGLPVSALKDPNTRLYIFTAQVFKEEE